MKLQMKHLAAMTLMAVTCVIPALAQDNKSQRSDRSDGQSSQQSDRQQESKSNRSEKNRNVRIVPQGWVSMRVDYDNDGVFDAVETLYVYDLEQARRSSNQRKSEGRRMSNNRQENQQMISVTGDINSIQSAKMAGMDQRHQLAKIETEDGKRLAVCLGTEQELSKLKLSEGDKIEVRGRKARVNDRTVLMAQQVTHDGTTVSPETQQRSKMKRVKAEVKSTRTVKFRNADEPHLIARVETQRGKTETVNMGPKSKFSNVDIEEGSQVKLLVRQGRINGQEALIAQEVNFDGQTIKLPRPQDRQRFTNSSRTNRGSASDRQARGDRRERTRSDQ